MTSAVAAVVFDLDGVLIDSEPVWEDVRKEFVKAKGGHWAPDAQTRMMGMSTREWSSYVNRDLGVQAPPEEIAKQVIAGLRQRYQQRLPLLDGAVEAVRRLYARWPLGLASSSPQELVEVVLDLAGLRSLFKVALSTELVGKGKPAPDIYLEVTRRLRVDARRSIAVEDSTNGIRAAVAAGLPVIAIPRPQYPPEPSALAQAGRVLSSLHELSGETVAALR